MNAPAAFLDPSVLARIDNLELLARTVVDGFINGLHRSPYLGLSLDFAEHRPYMPGDDIRRIDWRLYARTDRYHVKEFEADTNANFLVALDVSRSMSYGSGSLSKLDYGRFLAASLTYFARQQRDRVGVATFADDIVEYVPPSARHLETVLHTLARVDEAEASAGRLAEPLRKLADLARRRGILVVVSDLYHEPDEVIDALKPLAARRQDVIVFHVLDPDEVELDLEATTNFEDLETGDRLPVITGAMRGPYRQLLVDHVTQLGRRCAENRIDYTLLNTSTPLDYALFRFLSERERLSRVR